MAEFVEDEPIMHPLHLLKVIPYQSFDKNIFLNSITSFKHFKSCIVKELDVITNSRSINGYESIPIITYDRFDLFKENQILLPKSNSKWYNHAQIFSHKVGSKPPQQQTHFTICNSPLLTHDQQNIIYQSCPLNFNEWYHDNNMNKNRWKDNKHLQYLQQLSTKLQQKVSKLNDPLHLTTHCVITQDEIMEVLRHNWNYIDSINPYKETKQTPQAWTSYDNDIGYQFPQTHNNNNENNHKNFQNLFWKNNNRDMQSSMKCTQPGYLQCLDRTPMDMWSIHFQLTGTRLLFSTSQLTEKSTINLQTKLKHSPLCPYSSLHQQNIFPDINHLNKILCTSQQNGIKIYATVCFPGTVTIIKGGTLTFAASMSNHENWFQSILFKPDNKTATDRCNKYYKNHLDYLEQKKENNRTHPNNNKKKRNKQIPICSSNYHKCSDTKLWFGDELCHDRQIKDHDSKQNNNNHDNDDKNKDDKNNNKAMMKTKHAPIRTNLINFIQLYCKYVSSDHHKINQQELISFLLHFCIPRLQYIPIYDKSIGIGKSDIEKFMNEMSQYTKSRLLSINQTPSIEYNDINQIYHDDLRKYINNQFDHIIQFKQESFLIKLHQHYQRQKQIRKKSNKKIILKFPKKNVIKYSKMHQMIFRYKYLPLVELYKDSIKHNSIKYGQINYDDDEDEIDHFRLLIESSTDTKDIDKLSKDLQQTIDKVNILYSMIEDIEDEQKRVPENRIAQSELVSQKIDTIHDWINSVIDKSAPFPLNYEQIQHQWGKHWDSLNSYLCQIKLLQNNQEPLSETERLDNEMTLTWKKIQNGIFKVNLSQDT